MQSWRPNEFTLQTTLNQNPCGDVKKEPQTLLKVLTNFDIVKTSAASGTSMRPAFALKSF